MTVWVNCVMQCVMSFWAKAPQQTNLAFLLSICCSPLPCLQLEHLLCCARPHMSLHAFPIEQAVGKLSLAVFIAKRICKAVQQVDDICSKIELLSVCSTGCECHTPCMRARLVILIVTWLTACQSMCVSRTLCVQSVRLCTCLCISWHS